MSAIDTAIEQDIAIVAKAEKVSSDVLKALNQLKDIRQNAFDALKPKVGECGFLVSIVEKPGKERESFSLMQVFKMAEKGIKLLDHDTQAVNFSQMGVFLNTDKNGMFSRTFTSYLPPEMAGNPALKDVIIGSKSQPAFVGDGGAGKVNFGVGDCKPFDLK